MKFSAAVVLALASKELSKKASAMTIEPLVQAFYDDKNQVQCTDIEGFDYGVKLEGGCVDFTGTLGGWKRTPDGEITDPDAKSCVDMVEAIEVTTTCLDAGEGGKYDGAFMLLELSEDIASGTVPKVKTGQGTLEFDGAGLIGTCVAAEGVMVEGDICNAETGGDGTCDPTDKGVQPAKDYIDSFGSTNRCKSISNVELCFRCDGDAGGDPHFKTFGGEWFDFHGGCDLVLADMPNFANGLGLVGHVRTKTRFDWSFIEVASFKIGDDTLEVGAYGEYKHNGVEFALTDSKEIPSLGDYPIEHTQTDKDTHFFTIDLGHKQSITIKSYKIFVWVHTTLGRDVDFHGSTGLLGSWGEGTRFARDGTTVLEDNNEFGQEWQVRDTDPQLFTNPHPDAQWPQKCKMPTPKNEISLQRRLGMGISAEMAGAVCSKVKNPERRELCTADVLATQDLSIGLSGIWN